ncbi:hypothetical protein OMK64_10215, partial [Cellulomonas fimi]|uniref:hypothetical protein n=1 Tax=Cellulomonas fimi TaxID=1708 RepID=UPI00234D4D9F
QRAGVAEDRLWVAAAAVAGGLRREQAAGGEPRDGPVPGDGRGEQALARNRAAHRGPDGAVADELDARPYDPQPEA